MTLTAVSPLSLLQGLAYGGCRQRYAKIPDVFIGGEQSTELTTRVQCLQSLFDIAGWSRNRKMILPLSYRNRKVASIRTSNKSLQILQYPDPRVIVLDIEGTTTPISFVTDVLFPYASNNVRNHLLSTFDSDETQSDIELLRKQVQEDITDGIEGAQPIPPINATREEVVEAACANVVNMIKADRKVTALKELQGHIWRYGYAKGELNADVFDDVPKAFQAWHSSGTKVYIYSSGSREAQRQIFGNTQYGDLRSFLSGYFDTVTAGNKREAKSYKEIFLSVGVDEPSQIVFATDVLQEAVAAKEAGLHALIVLRPGNAPLPPEHGFPIVTSLLDI